MPMFVKRVTYKRGDKTYVYIKIVESYREGKRVRQRVIANLGREDALKQSGQLDDLAAAFTRLDPPVAGTRRDVGPLLLVRHFLRRLDVAGIVDRLLPMRSRAQLTHGEVVVALIANRLCAPAPLYDVAGWGSSAALHELFAIPGMLLNDDRLGRALDAFAPVAEKVRGEVALAAIEHFGTDAARLHLDFTTLRVAGAYEDSSLVAKGWGSDRRVARQVRLFNATNADGVPLYVRPDPGNAAELTLIGAALERLAELLPSGPLICADSALGHLGNLCAVQRAGLRFIVPLRASTGFAKRFLAEVGHDSLHRIDYVSRRQKKRPREERTVYRGVLKPFPVEDPETGDLHPFRVAWIWSSEEAKSVADARERALTKAEEALQKMHNGLGGRYYRMRKQVDTKVAKILGPPVTALLHVRTGQRKGSKPFVEWHRDEAAIAAATATDGVYALATNLPGRISASGVLRLYKEQWMVEQRHRDAKSTLKVRPVFLHNDDRIRALVSIVGLALLVFGLIESEIRRSLGPEESLPGLLPEGRAARPTGRNILAAFQGLGCTRTASGLELDRPTATQRRLLDLLEIPLPWSRAPV